MEHVTGLNLATKASAATGGNGGNQQCAEGRVAPQDHAHTPLLDLLFIHLGLAHVSLRAINLSAGCGPHQGDVDQLSVTLALHFQASRGACGPNKVTFDLLQVQPQHVLAVHTHNAVAGSQDAAAVGRSALQKLLDLDHSSRDTGARENDANANTHRGGGRRFLLRVLGLQSGPHELNHSERILAGSTEAKSNKAAGRPLDKLLDRVDRLAEDVAVIDLVQLVANLDTPAAVGDAARNDGVDANNAF
mmetsp:Transcript_25374/g.58445  ORF Transcript_25374/g.58445 Transcript_25374/m.58445 type:complete len:247 (+) Transcript_25374:456-1196(+)